MTTALLLGKFLPPSMGHKYLIDFASNYRVGGELVDLTVLVATLPNESIPGDLRYQWIKEHWARAPNVRVVHTNEVVPQDPSEDPLFWTIWKNLIERVAGTNFDLVFASENYGAPLAETLGASFVPVDIAREVVNVSGTGVRKYPGLFDNILPEARKYFRKRVVLFGAESVGKTTMTKQLAGIGRWDGVGMVNSLALRTPEYARGYLESHGSEVTAKKIDAIAAGQMAMIDAAELQAGPIIIQDTDLLATIAWSDILLGSHPDWIEQEAIKRKADLYIVLHDNVGFYEDPLRYGGDRRQMTTADAVALLERLDCNYRVVTGADYRKRMLACQMIINEACATWFAPIPQWKV